jgi:TonB family protein
MSYKALLFCPDGKTARVVTQVLGELEFTVESAGEPFATVKKLTDEHFDALVVDCENEQNASLLFKGARNSSLNHSSLYVAVVEGQTGVAKAFRIGANLVLTKPINIEQSKNTLRVARGLLRKNETKPAAGVASRPVAQVLSSTTNSATSSSASSPPNIVSAEQTIPAMPVAHATPAPVAPAASFAMIEVEQEATPATEAAEAALLESMPDTVTGKSLASEQKWAPTLKSAAEPIAASTGGHAAAAAPALAKVSLEIKTAAPMATQDAIVNGAAVPEHFEAESAAVPTFGSYAHTTSEPGAARLLFRRVATLLIFGVAGYFAWTRLQAGQTWSLLQTYIPSASSETPNRAAAPSVPAIQVQEAPVNGATETNGTSSSAYSGTPATASSASAYEHPARPEVIQVNEFPATAEPKVTITPKPQPLMVKTKTGDSGIQKSATQPAPPSIAIAESNNSDALASIVSSNAALPKVAAGVFPVSQGVSQGLLVKKVPPVYPPMALQLRKDGAVALLATVSREGSITGVKVVSGDAMLAKAAVEAVRQWKYRPYLLNGAPVEIETQITINFHLPR